ncbi:hypothetical protein [Ralstonia sp. 1138]|uniref:hypothetical protein n=1 Tax=Ralstonia sp. 1138 TaxID=3156423 RepID=UPI0033924F1E
MVARDARKTGEENREELHEGGGLHAAPFVHVVMGVFAVAVFAAVMFDVMNVDGYLAAWYTAVTGYEWPWPARCLLLPCSRS